MAAKNKPSPVLVVFLVIFILLSLILGVTTYLGFSGQSDYFNEAKKATDEKNKTDKDKDWYQFLAIAYKSYMGQPLTKTEQENLATLRKGFVDGSLVTSSRAADKDENVKVVRDVLDKNLGWDPATNRPAKSFMDENERLRKDNATLAKSLETTKTALDKARGDLDASQKELASARAAFQDALDKEKKKASDDLSGYIATIAERDNKIAEQGKTIETLKAEMAQNQGESTKKVQALEKERKQQELVNEKLRSQTGFVNILDYDHPKGKVIQVDQTGRMPFINLGSADNLKPGVTFSVYGADANGKPITFDVLGPDGKPVVGSDGKPEKEGKATLEVVSILGSHLAQARVTSVRDEGRDPIMRGDLLFNPGWDPSQRQHVAITGLIDLTGEGRDDMAEFLRMLDRQGVVVDAYLDLKDLQVKGKGIDRQTDFLILGTVPDFAGSEVAKEGDERLARRDAIIKVMSDMQQKAIDNGVTRISLRKFLAMSGVRVPKGAGIQTGSGSARPAFLTAPTAPAAPAAPKEAPRDKGDADKEKEK